MFHFRRTVLVFCLVFLAFLVPSLPAQARFALVIGNGDYQKLGKLKNPVNDATDMAASLRDLGFTVEMLSDASLDDMENAVVRLGNRLGQSAGSYGFFFYAGHGVQSGGINYLIPADANIAGEAFLKTRAMAAQSVLDTLQGANNGLNVVVLDACRDNPFGWARSGNRGLVPVSGQPAGSIIAYATSAGSVAQDGNGRNGLFTSQLLKNLKTPGLEIKDVLNRTGADVMAASNNKQVPAIYNQFFKDAFLSGKTPAREPATRTEPAASPKADADWGEVSLSPGSLSLTVAAAGTVTFNGKSKQLPAGASVRMDNLPPGDYVLGMVYTDGRSESRSVRIVSGQTVAVTFTTLQAQAATRVSASGGFSKRGSAPVLAGTYQYEEQGDCTVLYDQGTWHMWYSNLAYPTASSGRIAYATSADGINWTRFAGNPVMTPASSGFDSTHVYPGTVIREDGVFKMWYTAYGYGRWTVGYATSPDGISWFRRGSPVFTAAASGWDNYHIYGANVVKNGSRYLMWYTGTRAPEWTSPQIGMAESADGINWTRYSGNPVFKCQASWGQDSSTLALGGSVVLNGDKYEMWFRGSSGSNYRIGHATSTDGISWFEDPANPVLGPGSSGSWDCDFVQPNSVIKTATGWMLYYRGDRNSPVQLPGIGLAFRSE